MPAYSFKDVVASIAGIGGAFQFGNNNSRAVGLGSGAGVADEGISVERSEDRNTMQTGADKHITHSLHVADAGTVRIRLLKTSATNGLLLEMYKTQRASSAVWGDNVISVQDIVRGDKMTCTEVAFTGEPTLAWGKTAQVQEWTFHAGHIDGTLHTGATVNSIGG